MNEDYLRQTARQLVSRPRRLPRNSRLTVTRWPTSTIAAWPNALTWTS